MQDNFIWMKTSGSYRMNPFTSVELSEPNKMQKMLKMLPADNALKELNNLLAQKDFETISIMGIENISQKYKFSVTSKFKKEVTQMLTEYAEYHLNQTLPNKGSQFLPKLADLLGIERKKVEEILLRVGSNIFREQFKKAVLGRRLTEREKHILDQLQTNLGLPEDIADEISEEVRKKAVQAYINHMIEDGEISPDEEKELDEMSTSLSVDVMMDEKTEATRDKLRLIWGINHGNLPAIQPDILLQKSETCYYIQKVDWFEERAVRRNATYGGITGRIKIAKGIYYRYGKVGLSSQSTQEQTLIDSGKLYITNKRLIFAGSKKNVNIQFSHIINVQPYNNGIEIIKDSGKSPFLKFTDNVELFTAVLLRAISNSL